MLKFKSDHIPPFFLFPIPILIKLKFNKGDGERCGEKDEGGDVHKR